MRGLGSGPRCGTDGLGQYKTPYIPESVRDGLWRPEEAFIQTGFGCVMNHHITHRALHIPAQNMVGKFKMDILPIVSLTKAFPVAQICPKLA